MNIQTVRLVTLTVCPCGFPVLREEIKLGTEYKIDLDSVQRNGVYVCGKCGQARKVSIVLASQILNPNLGMQYLPYGLFSLPHLMGESRN